MKTDANVWNVRSQHEECSKCWGSSSEGKILWVLSTIILSKLLPEDTKSRNQCRRRNSGKIHVKIQSRKLMCSACLPGKRSCLQYLVGTDQGKRNIFFIRIITWYLCWEILIFLTRKSVSCFVQTRSSNSRWNTFTWTEERRNIFIFVPFTCHAGVRQNGAARNIRSRIGENCEGNWKQFLCFKLSWKRRLRNQISKKRCQIFGSLE